MKIYAGIFLAICLLVLITSCASPIEQLKKESPDVYNSFIGKWYILAPNEPGKILYTISFNDDGSVTGDTRDFVGYDDAIWVNPTKNSIGITFKPADKYPERVDEIFHTKSIDDIEYMNLKERPLHEIYRSMIPPLMMIKITYANNKRWTIGENESFLATRDINVINDLKEKVTRKELEDRDKWNKTNKNSISQHIILIKSVLNVELKSEIQKSLEQLLDKKIKKYFQVKHPAFSKYIDNSIIFENGIFVCRFYEFFRVPILGINPYSGTKINYSIESSYSGDNSFNVVISNTNNSENVIISFRPYKDKLVATGYKSGWHINPEGWQIAVQAIANAMRVYPKLDNIDVDTLNRY